MYGWLIRDKQYGCLPISAFLERLFALIKLIHISREASSTLMVHRNLSALLVLWFLGNHCPTDDIR